MMFTLGSRSQQITIDIVDDNLIEPYEFFTVSIVSSSLYNVVSKQKVIYIEDNDCKYFSLLNHFFRIIKGNLFKNQIYLMILKTTLVKKLKFSTNSITIEHRRV